MTGLWCLLEEKSCGFSSSSLSLCPTQSDDLHFILLYFLWFMFAASNYSFSFGKHYHPVLLHSRFPFILFRTVRPFPLLSLPWSLLLRALRVRRGSEGCAVFEMPPWVRSWCRAPHTWVGSALRHDSRANGERWCCLVDVGLVTFDSVQC